MGRTSATSEERKVARVVTRPPPGRGPKFGTNFTAVSVAQRIFTNFGHASLRLSAMAKAAGIESSVEVDGKDAADTLREKLAEDGPHVIVAKIEPGSPALTPIPLSSLVIRDRFREAVAAE